MYYYKKLMLYHSYIKTEKSSQCICDTPNVCSFLVNVCSYK
nr:MAG TPA: hypothetical protein [Caudoviricetes sp.]